MELIYTDENKKDIGVLKAASFDLAYGVDENNFEVSVPKKNHCCFAGSVIYIEGEEYGGIVDSIKLNTRDDMITYKGRSFHGILNSKIIEPPNGADYLVLSGDANVVLSRLISLLDLQELFIAESNPCGIIVASYRMDRYIKGYDGIRKMLSAFNAKLKVNWEGEYIKLSVHHIIDFSKSEFLIDTSTDMSIEKQYNTLNHIIGLGKGDLSQRKVIHIFTDKNGNIMPYAHTDNPTKNSDYILDRRNQQLLGKSEVCDVYDLSNAQNVENYVLMKAKPADWNTNYGNYYVSDGDGYKQLKDSEQAPVWANDKYYKQEIDEYAELVKGCLERIEKAKNSDKIDITLNPDRNYDIGDIVGGADSITGISVSRRITKKIVKRNSYGNYEISYEEGASI